MIDSQPVIKIIIDVLFSREPNRQQDWIDRIVKLNRELRDDNSMSFIYGGKHYRERRCPRGKVKSPSLHFDLSKEMAQYEKDDREMEKDKQFISQMLFQILHHCDNMQDIRDALPECIVAIMPELNQYTRLREAAYTIIPRWNNGKSQIIYDQYLEWLPKIELYVASRLIY